MARRNFEDVRRDERAAERDGIRELVEQKKSGLLHAIQRGRISAEMAGEVENILTSMVDDVTAGLHRMDIVEGKK